jgi:hypothetical protein
MRSETENTALFPQLEQYLEKCRWQVPKCGQFIGNGIGQCLEL